MDKLKEWPYFVYGIGPKGEHAHNCSTLEAAVQKKLELQKQGCWAVDIGLILESWNRDENEGQPRSLFNPEMNQ